MAMPFAVVPWGRSCRLTIASSAASAPASCYSGQRSWPHATALCMRLAHRPALPDGWRSFFKKPACPLKRLQMHCRPQR